MATWAADRKHLLPRAADSRCLMLVSMPSQGAQCFLLGWEGTSGNSYIEHLKWGGAKIHCQHHSHLQSSYFSQNLHISPPKKNRRVYNTLTKSIAFTFTESRCSREEKASAGRKVLLENPHCRFLLTSLGHEVAR